MKKKPGYKLFSLLLAVCLLSGCAAGAKPEERELPTPSPAALPVIAQTPPPESPPASDGVHAEVDYADMRWEVGDLEAFNALAEKLNDAADGEEAREHYEQLSEEFLRLRTNSELAWIEMYASGGEDSALSEACQALDEMLTQAADTLYTAASAVLKGPAGEEFTVCLGEELARELADYEPMTDREEELWARETALELRYNELESRRDISAAELNSQLGEIFLELIGIRNELAALYGYDSYAEYAYESVYGRDYTPQDAAALCRAVKPYARRFYERCSSCGALYKTYGNFSADELMDMLRAYAPRVSPEAARAQRYMERHGLYLLENYKNVTAISFTTVLPSYNAPFLFSALYGSVHDVFGLFHEFGHYYDAYLNPRAGDVTDRGSYDIFEIHSTSMEALLYGWAGEIFGADAGYARIYCLYGLVENAVTGCIYDEFLQYCYSHPDITVEDVNRAYREIASSYGDVFFRPSESYYWMYVNHNFISPFYYISYAASALASLQIWELAERDRKGALALYNDLVSKGAYELGYFELMDQVGLKRFTDDLDGCLRAPCEKLEELCLDYEQGKLAA